MQLNVSLSPEVVIGTVLIGIGVYSFSKGASGKFVKDRHDKSIMEIKNLINLTRNTNIETKK